MVLYTNVISSKIGYNLKEMNYWYVEVFWEESFQRDCSGQPWTIADWVEWM